MRKPTDEHRRTAMKQAETAGFGSPEAWAAVAAFWSGDSMAPAGGPESAAAAAFHRARGGRRVALAAARGPAARRETRLRHFLVSAKDIATGGVGRIEAETD